MIDTARPEVNFLSDTGAFVRADSVLEDHLYIRDNISNVQWFYYYARGGEIPSLRQQSEQYHTGDSIRLCIPANGNVVNTQTGIRAYLLIDDGVNRKTINLSRQVIRHKSDLQTTEPMVWTPVYATASLFNKSAATLISNSTTL